MAGAPPGGPSHGKGRDGCPQAEDTRGGAPNSGPGGNDRRDNPNNSDTAGHPRCTSRYGVGREANLLASFRPKCVGAGAKGEGAGRDQQAYRRGMRRGREGSEATRVQRTARTLRTQQRQIL
jgi:hypothetical protein